MPERAHTVLIYRASLVVEAPKLPPKKRLLFESAYTQGRKALH